MDPRVHVVKWGEEVNLVIKDPLDRRDHKDYLAQLEFLVHLVKKELLDNLVLQENKDKRDLSVHQAHLVK